MPGLFIIPLQALGIPDPRRINQGERVTINRRDPGFLFATSTTRQRR